MAQKLIHDGNRDKEATDLVLPKVKIDLHKSAKKVGKGGIFLKQNIAIRDKNCIMWNEWRDSVRYDCLNVNEIYICVETIITSQNTAFR